MTLFAEYFSYYLLEFVIHFDAIIHTFLNKVFDCGTVRVSKDTETGKTGSDPKAERAFAVLTKFQ